MSTIERHRLHLPEIWDRTGIHVVGLIPATSKDGVYYGQRQLGTTCRDWHEDNILRLSSKVNIVLNDTTYCALPYNVLNVQLTMHYTL